MYLKRNDLKDIIIIKPHERIRAGAGGYKKINLEYIRKPQCRDLHRDSCHSNQQEY